MRANRDPDDRRYKVLRLPYEFPLRFVAYETLAPGTCIATYRFHIDAFPSNLIVDNIAYDALNHCWSYLLYHPSWDAIPLGGECPVLQEDPKIEIIVIGDDPAKHQHSIGKVNSWRELPSLLGG